MSKQSDTKIIRQEVADQSGSIELNDQQLDTISGGTKIIDKSSAKLFEACATGEHIKTAK